MTGALTPIYYLHILHKDGSSLDLPMVEQITYPAWFGVLEARKKLSERPGIVRVQIRRYEAEAAPCLECGHQDAHLGFLNLGCSHWPDEQEHKCDCRHYTISSIG